MRQRNINVGMLIIVIGLAILACKLPFIGSFSPSEPEIPVSTEAAGALVENVQKAAATALSGGAVSLTVTEEQITSLAAIELQSMQEQRLRDLQIRLRNGQMIVSGTTTISGANLPVSVIMNIYVDAQHQVHTQLVSASVGPLPLTDSMVEEITRRIEQFIATQLAANAPNMVVDNIIIADGYMTISGYTR